MSQLCVVVAAVLILTACSDPAPLALPTPKVVVSDLVAEGYSTEVSNCVTGLADGIADGKATDQLLETCQRAEAMLNAPEEAPIEVVVEGPRAYGDDAQMDVLWDRCAASEGSACDELWELAPVASDYERFGVTCGERPEVLNCADLSPSPLISD